MSVSRARTLWCALGLASGCAHAGAGTEPDEQAAVAEGVRAALLLYRPMDEASPTAVCVEVASPAEFERGVVEALSTKGIRALAMPDCAKAGKDAELLVKVQSYQWTDWMLHNKLDMQGTVETRPDERRNFRSAWWRAAFRATLAFQGGHWFALSAEDLGRI